MRFPAPSTKQPPKMKANRTCARKECDVRLPIIGIEHGDPFCSALCSRKFHGVVFESDAFTAGKRGYGATSTRRTPLAA